jgi:hypothetical protein
MAKKVEKEGRYFTTMVIPDAKSKNASTKNEPWVLGSQVDQCFFIRSGKCFAAGECWCVLLVLYAYEVLSSVDE